MSRRYAIYFAPRPDSPWWTLGAHWLGRDEHRDAPLPQPVVPQLDAAVLREITAAPRRYGFHATLKAPFRLGDGHTAEDLVARVDALGERLRAVPLGEMAVTQLGEFVALVPIQPPAELHRLAAACVEELDDLRAPLTPGERARRGEHRLDDRGRELLRRYGYPHVMERFAMHLSLTGPVDRGTARRVADALAEPVRALNASAPLLLDRLCVFVETDARGTLRRIADKTLMRAMAEGGCAKERP